MIMFTLLAISSFLLYFLFFYNKKTRDYGNKLPGSPCFPLIGHAWDLMTITPQEILQRYLDYSNYYGERYRFYIGTKLYIVLSDPKDVEVVLNGQEFTHKSDDYRFLQPWLGEGLLTASGDLWKKHRKIITPSFHFKMWDDFIQIFHKQANILTDKLEAKCNGEVFDVSQYVNLFALDVICESAMGLSVNAQTDSESEYVNAVGEICDIINYRIKNLWMRFDFVFKFTVFYKNQEKYLKILHGFTDKVIKQRKLDLLKDHQYVTTSEEKNVYDEKKKMRFLDILLSPKIKEPLTDLEIREQVDTFMFEGHDTVSSAIGFALYELSKYPEIQEKLYQEQMEILSTCGDRPPTYKNIQEMTYLEMVIKETLRLYPSVPIIARTAIENTNINGIDIRRGTTITIPVFAMQRNWFTFWNSDKFIPERFQPEEINNRNTFSTPFFSAGPRNCIGQKFAMLELKTVLSIIIRKFTIEESNEKLSLIGNLVLKSENGINIRLTRR